MGALEEQPAVLNPRDTSLGPKNILSLSTTTRHVTPIKHFEGTLSSQGESLTPSDNPFQNQDLSFYPSSLPSPLPVPHYNWIYFGFSETSPGIAEIRQSLTLSGFLPRPSSILTPPPHSMPKISRLRNTVWTSIHYQDGFNHAHNYTSP